MKTLLTLLALLTAAPLFAADIAPRLIFSGRNTATPPGFVSCDTSDTTLPHDVFLEGFQGAGAENTWTAAGSGSGATFDFDFDASAYTVNRPVGACTEALQVTVNSVSVTENSYYYDHGTIDVDTVALDYVFHFNLLTPPDDTFGVPIMRGGSSANPESSTGAIWTATVSQSGATSTISIAGHAFTLTLGEWVEVKVHLDPTTTSSYVQYNGGAQNAFDRAAATDPRYFHVGQVTSAVSGDSCVYLVDVIALNTP